MKTRQNHLNSDAGKWADDALNSIDGIQRAQANPYLYSKVLAKIESRMGAWEKAEWILSRPAFALGSILVFLAINMAVILWEQKQSESELVQKLQSDQMLASEFMNAQNYQLAEINE